MTGKRPHYSCVDGDHSYAVWASSSGEYLTLYISKRDEQGRWHRIKKLYLTKPIDKTRRRNS